MGRLEQLKKMSSDPKKVEDSIAQVKLTLRLPDEAIVAQADDLLATALHSRAKGGNSASPNDTTAARESEVLFSNVNPSEPCPARACAPPPSSLVQLR